MIGEPTPTNTLDTTAPTNRIIPEIPAAATNGSVHAIPGTPRSRTIYVDRNRGRDEFTGLAAIVIGAEGPKKTIRSGLSTARNGDTLIIKTGRYGETLNLGRRAVSARIEGTVDLSRRVSAETTPPTGVSSNSFR